MNFHIVSLFPEFFQSPLQTGLLGKAIEHNLVNIGLHNPRDFAQDAHRSVDDRPYGGGPGMVMLLEPLCACIRRIPTPGRIVVMSPAGRPFTQAVAQDLAHEKNLTIVCGRYEGFDARLAHVLPVEYFSMGDAVLNGGETPALAIVEAVARLIPHFMGKEASSTEESFSLGLLEYPHFTRPEIFEGYNVPEILRSGDHKRIAQWRRQAALQTTLQYRPDLLNNAHLDSADAMYLSEILREKAGRHIYIALVHHPVMIEGKNSGTSSLTNLDIHDISRVSCTYGLGGVYVTHPLRDQQHILESILQHWRGVAAKGNPDREQALHMVRGVALLEDAIKHITAHTGQPPFLLGSSARFAEKKNTVAQISFAKIRNIAYTRPVLLVLGTAQGLAPEVLAQCDGLIRPLRFLDSYNHLSVRAAAAIIVDRILGDIY